jgi:hypothetical protein
VLAVFYHIQGDHVVEIPVAGLLLVVDILLDVSYVLIIYIFPKIETWGKYFFTTVDPQYTCKYINVDLCFYNSLKPLRGIL